MLLSVLDLVPLLKGADPQTAIRQTVLLAQAAERLGYTRFWVPEHHDMEQLASACPEVLLAHIGAYTTHIRIGSGAVLLPHYKALKVAEAFHLLATLHPGRIDLGIGRAPGGSAHVTMALSGNFLEHVRNLPDTLKELTDLLAGDFRLDDVPVVARPVPPEPPQLWLLGTNKKSAEYAAQYGTGYVFGQFMSDQDGSAVLSAYREQFQPSRLQRQARAIVAVGAVCAETEEEARRLAGAGGAGFGNGGEKKDSRENNGGNNSEDGDGANASGTDPLPERILIGTPGQIKERLHHLQRKYDVEEFMIVTHTPDYGSRLRSFELLAEEVLSK